MSGLAALADRLGDRLNPIIVKELRQAVQGRFIAATLVAFLLLQVLIVGLFLLSQSTNSLPGVNDIGQEVFVSLQALLFFVCVLVLPAYTGARMFAERSDNGLDLLWVTALPPRSIIAGKLGSAVLLAFLLYSACLPFFTFTYFLRGIDLPSIFILLAYGFGLVVLCLMFALLLACLPASQVMRIFLGMVGLGALFFVFVLSFAGVFSALESGVGSRLGDSELWLSSAAIWGLGLLVLGWMFSIAVALVSPATANRARPVRLFGLVSWLLSAIAMAVLGGLFGEDVVVGWIALCTVVWALAVMVAISSPDRLSQRVTAQVPRNPLLRAGAFFLFSGAASGLAWTLLLAVLTLGSALAIGVFIGPTLMGSEIGETALSCSAFTLYCLAYGLCAVWIRRTFLARRLPSSLTWLVALALVALGTIGPLIGMFLVDPDEVFSARTGPWELSNPFAAFESDLRMTSFFFAASWCFVALLLTRRWLGAQLQAFHPPVPAAAWKGVEGGDESAEDREEPAGV